MVIKKYTRIHGFDVKNNEIEIACSNFLTIYYLVCPDIIQDNLLNNESISHFRYHNSNNKV
jgi:hypothetical protein